jgi:hypothetical protein
MHRIDCIALILSGCIAVACTLPKGSAVAQESTGPKGSVPAPVQSGSVMAVFKKHNLLGTFAVDCSRPPDRGNLYYVHRLVTADRVQRDQMSGPTTRDWFIIIDHAEERGPNQVFFRGQRDGQRGEGLWHVEQGRLLQLEGSLAGQKLLSGGKVLATGRSMPWLARCASVAR